MRKLRARCTVCGKKIKAKTMKELLVEMKAHEAEHDVGTSFQIEKEMK